MSEIEQWIKTLKPGDEVALKVCEGRHIQYRIRIVKNVTKSGRVRLETGVLYDQRGQSTHRERWSNRSYSIVKITDDILGEMKKLEICISLSKVDFKEFKLEQLERILKIIEE